jgi:formylglycine-generating enzyme required for sulfatase activity
MFALMRMKSAMRRSIRPVCLLAIITLLAFSSWLTANNASSAGQGKGGEVIAKPKPKPTPTPKKTSTTTKVPLKKNPPAARQAPCLAQMPTQATGRSAYPTGRRHAVNLNGGVSLEMVEIPKGSFCMGSNDGEANEKPVHQVTINYSFYVGKYEVTQAQWQAAMGSNPSSFKGGLAEPFIKLPVEQVSWEDAQNFINKLNDGNDGFTYRLPTEAEWEYACRAGTTGDHAGNLSAMAWYAENSENRTHTVGQKQPNAWGLFDMHGNVWEWCQDRYHDSYNGAPTDGSAWLSGGEQKYRVLRGGSWLVDASGLRSAIRTLDTPDARNDFVGFRVVAVARTQ